VTPRLPKKRPLLYLITEGTLTDENFSHRSTEVLAKIERATQAGVELIQIREKCISARNLTDLAREAFRITQKAGALLLINDRVDIAMAAGLDGVHLTEGSLPVSVVRVIAGEGILIGCSRHSVEGLRQAESDGADLAVFGPVFATLGKGEPVGLGLLKMACEVVPRLPVLGLGGIDASNMNSVFDAGAAGIASIRFLNDPEAVSALQTAKAK
jgi:thiamine-phosphate pyrophosphorylase